jgi:hypothetical protein
MSKPQPYEVNGLRIDPPDLEDPGSGHVFDGVDDRPILTWDNVQRSWQVSYLRHSGDVESSPLGGRRDHVEDVIGEARRQVLGGRLVEAELDAEDTSG